MTLQQLDAEQSRMTLVHVVLADLETQRVQQADAADAEHDLLLEPVSLVAAVQVMSDLAVSDLLAARVELLRTIVRAPATDSFTEKVQPATRYLGSGAPRMRL